MYLKSIELSGFKSFAKKSGFEFNTPISAIVGPNGSGKSNVAEAFRFVLGEQSIKSMRGKRGEDLIWNGSQAEPRAGRASVRVVFDNERKIFDIDFPEVTVERVVHRDGENEYLINGSQVRLKDVIELLARAHIGSSGHHIISQGEADKIISANSKERKNMVEDALGLKLYQYKRIESEKKLEKTFENIGQVESLRKEIAPHLRFLKKQVDKLEKTEGMREELISLAKTYFKQEEAYLKDAKESLEKERSPLTDGLKKLESELAEAKTTLAKSGEKDKKEYLVLELEKELSSSRLLKDATSRELGKVEGLIDAEEATLKKHQESRESQEHKMIRLKEVEDLYSELEKETDTPGLLERVKTRVLNFIKGRRESLDSLAIDETKKILEGLERDRETLEKKLNDALENEKKLENDYESLKSEQERAKDSSHDAEKAVFRIMSEENELHSKLNMLKLREESIKTEEGEFKRGLEELGRLVGTQVLNFSDTKVSHREDRSVQDERKRSIERLKIRLEDSDLVSSDEVMKEFRETSERDEFLIRELADLEKSAESLKNLIKDLEHRLSTEFETGLENINKEFEKLFSKMFGGGEAELALVKSEQVVEGEEVEKVEEGLDVRVSLPRKKIRGLMMLSGGERALTSIALIFAISAVNPPPFIILDETDAALDEANSKKYGDMIEHLSKYSQLILITHNRETMSRAGVIYGVTMGSSSVSKVLSIAFEDAVAVAK